MIKELNPGDTVYFYQHRLDGVDSNVRSILVKANLVEPILNGVAMVEYWDYDGELKLIAAEEKNLIHGERKG